MKRFLLAGVFAIMATFGFSSSADAAFRLRVEDPAANGGAGYGAVLTAGVSSSNPDKIKFDSDDNGVIGNFTVLITTGLKTPLLQIPGYYTGIDLNNVSIQSSGAGSLRLILEYDGFDIPGDGETLEVTNSTGGVLSGPAGSSVTFTSYANHDAGQPVLGAEQASVGNLSAVTGIGASPAVSASLTFGPGSFDGNAKTSFVKSGNYSLYSVVDVNFTGAGSISFNNLTQTSPAPAGLVLALTAAPFGFGAWLRRRRSAVQA